MKKLLKIVGIMAVVMSLVTTVAFAATSKTVTVEAKGATDDKGNSVVVTANTTTTTITQEEAVKLINESDIDAKKLTVAYVKDLSVPDGTTFPVKITFNVSGVSDDQAVYVFHWGGNAWELVGKGTGSKVDATFRTLSPVAIVVQNESKSYNTGATDYTPLAIMAILTAMAAAGVAYKREA